MLSFPRLRRGKDNRQLYLVPDITSFFWCISGITTKKNADIFIDGRAYLWYNSNEKTERSFLMILYYSASGNTEHIARILAKKLDDECLDLRERIRSHDYTEVISQKPFVICAPVYVSEMPRFQRDYIKRLPFRGSREVYYVFTCGVKEGIAGALAETITVRKDMVYMGHTGIAMPSNYIVSNMFPAPTHDKCVQLIRDAEKKAEETAETIKNGGRLVSYKVDPISKALTIPLNAFWSKFMQPTKKFFTTDKCVGCGKCSKICPLNNIHMENKRPVWEAPCAHCMACISNCPAEAIEYSDITQKKEKYHISKYLDKTGG